MAECLESHIRELRKNTSLGTWCTVLLVFASVPKAVMEKSSGTARMCDSSSPFLQYYPLVMIQVRACKSGGIDTRIHSISIIGRVDMNEDEVAANFSFLTVEDTNRDTAGFAKRRKKDQEAVDIHSNKVHIYM